jgi:probable ATP-dependent RNA helicase DDX4
MFSCRF